MSVGSTKGTGLRAGARLMAWASILFLVPAGCITTAPPAERLRRGPPPAVADCGRTTGYDVIIVGAGLSGLTASRELRRSGRGNVLILEATGRIGGRARTLKEGPPIDLGGAWIHGIGTNPLTGLADAMGFERVPTELEGPTFIDNGTEVSILEGDEARHHDEEFEEFEQSLAASAWEQRLLNTCPKDSSEAGGHKAASASPRDGLCRELRKLAKDTASAHLPERARYKALIANNSGPLESAVELEQNSTVDAAEFEADPDDLLKEGMGNFVEAYGAGEPVCLHSPVTRISYREDGVEVEVKDGRRYQGRKALVTVPTGVLKAGKIQFEPALPAAKQAAIEGLPMGNMQKVIMDFKTEAALFAGTRPNSWVLYQAPNKDVMAFVIKPLGKNIAIGFYGGEQAKAYEAQCKEVMGQEPLPPQRLPCDEQAVQRARAALIRMYGAQSAQAGVDLASEIDKADIYMTRWSLDPWALGAYSAARPDAWQMREELGKPVGNLYFAGEATARPMYNGSFAGAFESGIINARRLLESLAEEEEEAAKAAPVSQQPAR